VLKQLAIDRTAAAVRYEVRGLIVPNATGTIPEAGANRGLAVSEHVVGEFRREARRSARGRCMIDSSKDLHALKDVPEGRGRAFRSARRARIFRRSPGIAALARGGPACAW